MVLLFFTCTLRWTRGKRIFFFFLSQKQNNIFTCCCSIQLTLFNNLAPSFILFFIASLFFPHTQSYSVVESGVKLSRVFVIINTRGRHAAACRSQLFSIGRTAKEVKRGERERERKKVARGIQVAYKYIFLNI